MYCIYVLLYMFRVSCLFADYNFSHRIDQFSYGHETPGIINPLDGVEKVTSESTQSINYQAIKQSSNHWDYVDFLLQGSALPWG